MSLIEERLSMFDSRMNRMDERVERIEVDRAEDRRQMTTLIATVDQVKEDLERLAAAMPTPEQTRQNTREALRAEARELWPQARKRLLAAAVFLPMAFAVFQYIVNLVTNL